jgi:transposase InsO family protein
MHAWDAGQYLRFANERTQPALDLVVARIDLPTPARIVDLGCGHVGERLLKAALAYYESLGVSVTGVMTDNGSCYRAFDFRDACRNRRLRHIRIKPYTPKTNGKAERFIQTALREWAYAQAYPTSQRRAEELPFWLHRYNWHRPHGGIKAKTPISRLGMAEDNLLRLHN